MRAAFDDACARGRRRATSPRPWRRSTGCTRVVYAATGNPEFERTIAAIGPRFDRVLYLWYTDSISGVATSYRRDLLVAIEDDRREDAVEIMRAAWQRFRDVIAAPRAEDACTSSLSPPEGAR